MGKLNELAIVECICSDGCNKNFPDYTYAGLQAGEHCWCGDDYQRHGLAFENECDTPCPGNLKRMCGGTYKNSMYLGNTL